ncbi:MAG: M20/M25/M40 family metallo-hydrolase [Desulfomicrobium sp.]|nr:M20/M25/M40 family metallo-hydrolase [Desulfomicrobium sp.]
MVNIHRLTECFFDLVRITSPSLGEKDVAQYLCTFLAPRGYDLHVDNAGDFCGGNTGNVIVRVPATGPGAPLAFSAHMDCVPPCTDVQPVTRDGRIYSAGNTVLGGDDKAGIAAIVEALFHLEEENLPHPELYLLFTICEEAGMFGAKYLDYSRVAAEQVVVLDACGNPGTIIVHAPAKTDLTITFTGRAAHAGIEPELGINAIQIAADAISRMQLGQIDASTVANIGFFQGGGPINIVPDLVIVRGEVRSHSQERLDQHLQHLRQCCTQAVAIHGGGFDFQSELSYPALDISADSPLVQRALGACHVLNLPASLESTGGGSDANIFSARGWSCINLGIGMSKVHTTDEYISLDSLEKITRLVAQIMLSQ